MAGSSSAPTRFIVRRTAATLPAGEVEARLRDTKGVVILDASPRMMLVDASRTTLERVLATFEGWELVPESFTPLPDTRPKPGSR